MKKILKFLILPYQKKKLLGQTLFILCVIRLGLWIFPFKRLNRWLSAFEAEADRETRIEWGVVDKVTSAVKACSRYVPYASCLTQALATRTLLGLRGQQSQLKIGVDRDEDGHFMAHAWIEVNEKIVIGRSPHHPHYNVLKSTGSARI